MNHIKKMIYKLVRWENGHIILSKNK